MNIQANEGEVRTNCNPFQYASKIYSSKLIPCALKWSFRGPDPPHQRETVPFTATHECKARITNAV